MIKIDKMNDGKDTANPQGSQNAGICFKWSELLPDEKSSEAPDRFTRRSAHLWQKRFVPDNTCFVDAHFFAELFIVNAEARWLQTGKKKS